MKRIHDTLETSGLRPTKQREHVYNILLQERDHPTAEEIFIRAKAGMPAISLATVYNCLEALEACGLVRQVNLQRAATRYCPNMHEHHHFYCDSCESVFDVPVATSPQNPEAKLPSGFEIRRCEVSFRGLCPSCQPSKIRRRG